MTETQPAKINPVVLLILAGVLGYLLLNSRSDDRRTPTPVEKATVVIVPPVGYGASTKLDEWAAKNNVEIRRYREDANIALAEPKVRELFELTKGNRPCAITDLQGRIEILPLDANLLSELESMR